MVNVVYSKPFALLKFMETTKGGHGISVTFQKQIDSSSVLRNDAFLKLKDVYQGLQLDYSYVKQEYPERRKHSTSTWDLICVAAISSNRLDEFYNRIVGIIPNDDYLKLKQVLSASEPFYDRFMLQPQHQAIHARLKKLQGYGAPLNDLFLKFKSFYGSSWDATVPFRLAIYPIYGKRGQTTATPHANSLEMGFLLGSVDTTGMLSVGVHEMCHVLFEEQPLLLQQRLDSAFTATKDPYATLAYRYIDEALATALGNGFGYKYLSNELDTGDWYADDYINRYAKALYPLVVNYLEKGKTMDPAFVEQAIGVFRQTFPQAPYAIDAAMMRSDAYFEDDDRAVIDPLIRQLHTAFRIYMSNTAIPIDDPSSVENINVSEQTQVFVVYKNQEKNLKLLRTLFTQIKGLSAKGNALAGFLDNRGRPVFIIVAENASKASEGISLLKQKSRIDPTKTWQKF